MAIIPAPESAVWQRRLGIGIPIVTLVLVFTSMNLIGAILISRDLRDAKPSQTTGSTDDGQGTALSATPPAERPKVSGTLSLTEFAVASDLAEVPAWAEVTLTVTNDGTIAHDAKSDDVGTAMLDPGDTETITVMAPGSGELVLICTVPGHESAGMQLAIPVVGGEPSHDTTATTAAAASADNAAAYTGEKPALQRRDPALPKLAPGTVHNITFTVEEKVMQVAKDVWQAVWTFNGLAPGPTLHIKVGDCLISGHRSRMSRDIVHTLDAGGERWAWRGWWSPQCWSRDGPKARLHEPTGCRGGGCTNLSCATRPRARQAWHHVRNARAGHRLGSAKNSKT